MDTFDYIVVGAGSAGCAVARRLSDHAQNRVLLIEAGDAPSGFWMRTPAGMARMFSANRFNWSFETQPIAQIDYRRLVWPRGKIQLANTDAAQTPKIYPAYFSHPDDMIAHIRGMHLCRRILATPPLAKSVCQELLPGAAATSDDTLANYIRRSGKTSFHACGTCKMGSDPMAVVDARLRVHGFTNLRVIDASIMPNVVSANTNAPTIMVGEKGVEMLLADNGLSNKRRPQ